MIRQLFLSHPASVDETYLQHMAFAARFGLALFAAASAALVHAVFPFIFEKTAGTIVRRLHEQIATRAR